MDTILKEVPESTRLILDTVRRFVKQDLEPISQKVEDEDRIPDDVVDTMKELGLFGLSIPEEYGGLGLDVLSECLVYEEMSKVNACFRTRIGTNNGIGSQGIVIDGTEEQKEKYLPRLASGEWIGVFALTEPEAGSDAANIQTAAELKGDKWILNGPQAFYHQWRYSGSGHGFRGQRQVQTGQGRHHRLSAGKNHARLFRGHHRTQDGHAGQSYLRVDF